MAISSGTEAVAADADRSAELAERVRTAAAAASPLVITGGASKAFYGRPVAGEALEMGAHRGVIAYEPTELILTARAGTPLTEIEALLADNGQMLAFEPPHFAGGATLGGVIATGLSGPRRPFAGAVRDHVLGVRLLDGQANAMRFGGEVIKNVAGYDVARLVTGALGTLGVILDVSLKVLPRPEAEATVRLAADAPTVSHRVEAALQAGAPITGVAHDGDAGWVRLSGARSSVEASAGELGETVTDETDFWAQLRDHRLAVLAHDAGPLWRIALPPRTALPELPGQAITDWNGQLAWLRSAASADEVCSAAASVGGHATLFRGGAAEDEVFTPLEPALMRYHQRLKSAFDPQRILNPGRMYPEL